MARSAPDWPALQAGIAGDLVLPERPRYDAACKPEIAKFDDLGRKRWRCERRSPT